MSEYELPHPREGERMSHHVRDFESVPTYFRDRLIHHRQWRNMGRILEVGCSVGMFLGLGDRVGLDPDREAVAIARKRGFKAEVGSVLDIPFPDDSFDGVECREVLEHVFEPGKAVRECLRVLRPGGKLFIEVPNIRVRRFDFWNNYEHVYPFTVESITNLVMDSGGVEVESQYGYRGIWGSNFLNRAGLLSLDGGLKIQDVMYAVGLKDRSNIFVTGRKSE